MCVDRQRDLCIRVAEQPRDRLEIDSLRQEHLGGRMSRVVEMDAPTRETCIFQKWLPDPSMEVAAPERPALRVGENEPFAVR